MAKVIRRRCYFVDGQVQGALVLRVVRYWLLSLFVVGGLTFLGWMFIYPGIGSFVGPDALLSKALPIFLMGILATILAVPVALRDLVRFSNRFVGPMVRLHRSMKQLAEGQTVQLVKLRDCDYWQDFAGDFNTMVQRVRALEAGQLTETDETSDPKFVESTHESCTLPVETVGDTGATDACCEA